MNSSPRIRSQRYQMIQTVLLSVYSLVLFGMHFIRIFDNSFWGDESYTIQLVKMNFFRMCFTTAKDVHPPLYYFFTQILYFILATTATPIISRRSFLMASFCFWPVPSSADGSG